MCGELGIYPHGFNVFKRDGKEKIPTFFFLKSREPFAFAGF